MNVPQYEKIIRELTVEQFSVVDAAVLDLWHNNGKYTDNMLKAIAYKLLLALGEG